MRILVTGSSGLIGSEAVRHFDALGHITYGIDNNMRREFFGPGGDTTWNLRDLLANTARFEHHDIDIRDRQAVLRFYSSHRIDATVHCAAQPSHDLAASMPFVDFDVNAMGTMNLLESARQHAREAPFVFMSTNKVYGDAPNEIQLVEMPTRWEYADGRAGITEEMRIDSSKHSLFGASKVAADVMVQEYGRYFGMATVCFRGGCLTGPAHSGVELHGFLSYLVKVAIDGAEYRIYGYKGKQVRDNIHSADVVKAFERFIDAPRPAEIYNLGGGRENSISMIEAIEAIEGMTGTRVRTTYVDANRQGDHICYISDLGKLRGHYPGWSITRPLRGILEEMVRSGIDRRTSGRT
ncbi:MAG: NAD-dependent epimerase/dehydratase family protein [Acidobacteria bacterium]|nr:NAD-dependent epimerase/dehydratase family protein [Acidobacteriota bacterium]